MAPAALDGAGPILPLGGPGGVPASRAGPKAVMLARLSRAGLPVPDGFCVAVEPYRDHLAAAGAAEAALRVAGADDGEAGRLALQVRLALFRAPLDLALAEGLEAAHRRLCPEPGAPMAVRSSALGEDAATASFAGQLETILGVSGREELAGAVRACWASLWLPRAVRYMRARGLDPARGAVAVLVQPLVRARAAGGALSATPGGRLVLTAAWGLGPAVAQGEVVPDRYVLRRDGPVLEGVQPGRKDRSLGYRDGAGLGWHSVPRDRVTTPCLGEAEALALARLVLAAEAALGLSLEVEWALDEGGFQILQARPLGLGAGAPPQPGAREGAGWTGQPSGAGWAVGRARVVRTEAELDRVAPGDVLITRVPGPALAAILPRVVAVVAELGGSTSHLAALARERGIPAVLGVLDATRCIADGALLVVDGIAGVVHAAGATPSEEPGLRTEAAG